MAQQTISVANGETQSKIYDIVKDGVIGLSPDSMREISMRPINGGVKFMFKEPNDTVIDGHTVCNVYGVRVIMKEGAPPRDENDGTLILENEELGKYINEFYEVNGLTNGTTYYFGFFPYSDHNIFNRDPINIKVATPRAYELYGFKIDKNDPNPTTRITYLGDTADMTPAHMDFDAGQFDYGSWYPNDIFFLKNNKPFMVNSDGTPAYELDENDYTKKKNGTDSDVANTAFDGNAMAKMETVWLYQYQDEQYEYCYVCDIKLDDNYHAYAHERADGTIQDYIWLAMFEGSLVDNKLRSLKNQPVMTEKKASQEITYATANGDLWYTRTWSQRNLINVLLYLMFRSDDLQTALGKGYHTGATLYTERLPIGGASDKGRFYGSTADRDYVKCFHIENWWGNIWERIAGIINVRGDIRVKMTPPYHQTMENYNAGEYISTGLVPDGGNSGFISKTNMNQYGRIGYCSLGSETTYTCDAFFFSFTDFCYGLVGGCGDQGLRCGPMCSQLGASPDITNWEGGAALSCEQPLI